jgi:hypothetical protein
MGNSQAPSDSVWVDDFNKLDLDKDCKAFEMCMLGYVSDHKLVRKFNLGTGQTFTVSIIKEVFPKTYAIMEKLYAGNVAFVWRDYRYNNTIPLDVCGDCRFCYKMPPEYTTLKDTFDNELKAYQEEEKERCEKSARQLLNKFAC